MCDNLKPVTADQPSCPEVELPTFATFELKMVAVWYLNGISRYFTMYLSAAGHWKQDVTGLVQMLYQLLCIYARTGKDMYTPDIMREYLSTSPT